MEIREPDALGVPGRGSDLLALAFGTTVAMWAVGYVCRFPGVATPPWLLLALLLVCLAAGGWAAGRFTARGLRGGLEVGLLVGLLNLLVLGSVLSSGDDPNRLVPAAAWWIPGSLLLAGVVGGLGALVGRRRTPATPQLADHGLAGFAVVAAGATFLLLVAGGIVTGSRAGLAVTDWPNSYGYNMFLYPLSRMTGGIYYEHVHRLLGSLVGLTTLVLAVHLQRVEDRRWVKNMALVALALVVIQGVLGGLRVTGRFTLSDDPAATRPNLTLAVVHGIAGQLFFATVVAIAAFVTRRWRDGPPAIARAGAGLDHRLGAWFLGAVVLQLALGALLRHADAALHAHLTLAVAVLVLGGLSGSRLLLKHRDLPLLRRLGRLLHAGLGLQLVLGFAALVARNLAGPGGGPHPADVVVTTFHQAVGALLLALAVLCLLWSRRLLQPADR
ncbi:MAG TPA: COX15/CtaA family protein [Candidatus Krumholzibacteria bacterium]|nr:COX15/CtaA family protein [Candidatus Krumholzibacteria bacterium]HPD70709.1 COX15/CtaA family protein [Candidatus Krumholzibacteria bacterium]HRY39591.1 COX15/CtaA family protein [Candidatus Krumholzibacteria bacterium]